MVNKKTFFDFFPVPSYLAMPSVGLSLTGSCITAMSLQKRGFGFIPKEYGSICIPSGVIENGELKKPDVLIKHLKEAKEKFGIKFANTALPEQKSYIFQTQIPFSEDVVLEDVIASKIQENVPLSAEEAVFDFDVVGEKQKESIDVVVSVLPLNVVSMYISVLEEAGIIPVSLEVESQAVAKSIVPRNDKKTTFIVNIDREHIGLYVVYKNVVHYASSVFITNDDAAKSGSHIKIPAKNKDEKDVFVSISSVVDEMHRIISFWNNRDNFEDINKIILCGQSAADPEFANKISGSFSIDISVANVWGNAFDFDDYIPPISYKESLSYASVIGLALPHKK